MIKLNRAGQTAGWLLVFILMTGYCQHYFAYNYFYAEQFYLFRFDSDYAWQTLSQPGGVVTYLAAFLTQFFFYTYAGAVLSALLFTMIAWQMSRYWKRIAPNILAPLFYFLPSVALLWIQTDFNYHWEGTLALWISLLMLDVCLAVRKNLFRWVITGAWAIFGYYFVGPYGLLTVAGVVMADLFTRQTSQKWWALCLLLFAGIVPLTLYYKDVVLEWRFLLTSDAYYHSRLNPPAMLAYAGGFKRE